MGYRSVTLWAAVRGPDFQPVEGGLDFQPALHLSRDQEGGLGNRVLVSGLQCISNSNKKVGWAARAGAVAYTASLSAARLAEAGRVGV